MSALEIHSDEDYDEEVDDDDVKKSHLSEKGKRMADLIAEYILMRHFFGHVDRKKQALIKTAF